MTVEDTPTSKDKMRCPTLAELPPPPPGRTGWPWTEATPPLPATQPDGRPWPRISIVTPSLNQGRYIEETIRSVLLQGYPDLEYIIIDGGSSDTTIDVIKKYGRWIDHWVSEPDCGQPHAINKGIRLATGAAFNWINSDDFLEDGALRHIAMAFDQWEGIVAAAVRNVCSQRGLREVVQNRDLAVTSILSVAPTCVFHQPGVWLPLGVLRTVGGLDERFHYAFDLLLVLKLLSRHCLVRYIETTVANFRLHEDSKTCSAAQTFDAERYQILRLLAKDSAFAPVRHHITRRIARIDWWNRLESIRSSPKMGSHRAFEIVRAAVRHLPASASRFTLGAIRAELRVKGGNAFSRVGRR